MPGFKSRSQLETAMDLFCVRLTTVTRASAAGRFGSLSNRASADRSSDVPPLNGQCAHKIGPKHKCRKLALAGFSIPTAWSLQTKGRRNHPAVAPALSSHLPADLDSVKRFRRPIATNHFAERQSRNRFPTTGLKRSWLYNVRRQRGPVMISFLQKTIRQAALTVDHRSLLVFSTNAANALARKIAALEHARGVCELLSC
jgi:hypothetical protein